MMRALKLLVRRALDATGYDIVRASHVPKRTLLGLGQQSIKTIIDVGANQGQYAHSIRKLFPSAQIYCFEPIPEAFRDLEQWASMQHRVKVLPVAIGSIEGMITMFQHLDFSPSSSILKTTGTCETLYPQTKHQAEISVPIMTLDQALEPYVLEDGILIKMDVQGYEDRIIQGGMLTFQKAKACQLEINLDSLYEGQSSFDVLIAQLYQLGFHYAGNLNQVYDVQDGHVISIDSMFFK